MSGTHNKLSTGITSTTQNFWTDSWTSIIFIFLTLTRHAYLNKNPKALIIGFLNVFEM